MNFLLVDRYFYGELKIDGNLPEESDDVDLVTENLAVILNKAEVFLGQIETVQVR